MSKKELKTKSKIMRMTETEAKELDELLSRTDLNFSQFVRKGITDLKNELDEALLHKPICKGFFSDIIFK